MNNNIDEAKLFQEISELKSFFQFYNQSVLTKKRKKNVQPQQKIITSQVAKKKEDTSIQLKPVSKNIVYHHFIWDDITFQNNQIKLDMKRTKDALKPIPCDGIFESLNLIKKDYFERLYPKALFKLAFVDGEIRFNESPGWKKLLETIELSKNYYEFKFEFNSWNPRAFSHLGNKEIVTLFETSIKKSKYLTYLASLQTKEYKIIPILEYISNRREESFLFRFKTKKYALLIIWENVNQNRATHLFISKGNTERQILELVQGYIYRNDISSKRSILHYSEGVSQKLKEKLHFLKSVRHKSLEEYQAEIEFILSGN